MATLRMPIYVPSDLLEALGEHTGHFWSDPQMEPIIFDAIRAWMKPVPAAPQQPAARSEAGCQWKQVFLPEGTRLRASFGGKPCFAVVEGAEIKFGEHALSPSRFANLHGSGNRNAWKAVWLRFPGSDEWLLADVCRKARKAVIARMFGDAVQEVTQPSRAARGQRPDNGRQRPDKARQRPSSRQRASGNRVGTGTGAGGQAPAVRQLAPLPTGSGPGKARPSEAPEDAHSHGAQARHGSGRAARRKRRQAKQAPGNP